jgi:hypothetical protein
LSFSSGGNIFLEKFYFCNTCKLVNASNFGHEASSTELFSLLLENQYPIDLNIHNFHLVRSVPF